MYLKNKMRRVLVLLLVLVFCLSPFGMVRAEEMGDEGVQNEGSIVEETGEEEGIGGGGDVGTGAGTGKDEGVGTDDESSKEDLTEIEGSEGDDLLFMPLGRPGGFKTNQVSIQVKNQGKVTITYTGGDNKNKTATVTGTNNKDGTGEFQVKENSIVTLVASDGVFEKYTGGTLGNTSQPEVTFKANKNNTNIVAHFKKVTYFSVEYKVVKGNGDLSAIVDETLISSGAKVEQEKAVVFTANPNPGYKVKEWKYNNNTVKDNKTNNYKIDKLTENANVTVEFEKASYNIDLVVNTGGVAFIGKTEYEPGTYTLTDKNINDTINVKAYSNAGYSVEGFLFDNEEDLKNPNSTSYTVSDIENGQIVVLFNEEDNIYGLPFYEANGYFSGYHGDGKDISGHDPKDDKLEASMTATLDKAKYELGNKANITLRVNVYDGDGKTKKLNEIKFYNNYNMDSQYKKTVETGNKVEFKYSIPKTVEGLIEDGFVLDGENYTKEVSFDLVDLYNENGAATILANAMATINVSVPMIYYNLTLGAKSTDPFNVINGGTLSAPSTSILKDTSLSATGIIYNLDTHWHEFAHFRVDGNIYNTLDDMSGLFMTKDTTVTGYFNPLWYDFRFPQSSDGNCEVKLDVTEGVEWIKTISEAYGVSDVVTVTAKSELGFTFKEWDVKVTPLSDETDLYNGTQDSSSSEYMGEGFDISYATNEDGTLTLEITREGNENIPAHLEPEFKVEVEPIYEKVPTGTLYVYKEVEPYYYEPSLMLDSEERGDAFTLRFTPIDEENTLESFDLTIYEGENIFENIPIGEYLVTEVNLPKGYEYLRISSCDDNLMLFDDEEAEDYKTIEVTIDSTKEAPCIYVYNRLAPSIKVEKTVNKSSARRGETVEYTIKVTNDGKLDLYNINIIDELLKYNETFYLYETEEGALEPGEYKEIKISYIIPANASNSITNTVEVVGEYLSNVIPLSINESYTPAFNTIEDSDSVTITITASGSSNTGNTGNSGRGGTGGTVTPTPEPEEEIKIEDESIPESGQDESIEEVQKDEEIEILDQITPIGAPTGVLPKTGGIPAGLFYLIGAGISGLGIVIRKKRS